MFSAQRSTQPTGHEKIVTSFSTGTRDPPIPFNETGHADRNNSRAAGGAGFATDNPDIEPRGRALQTAIKFFDPRCRSGGRQDQGNESKLRNGGGGREIAQWPHHRFPADKNGISRRREMNFFNHAIGFQDKKILPARRFDHGAIIARTSNNSARNR